MKRDLLKGNSDFLLGAFIIAFSGAVFWLCRGIRVAEAAMLPRILAVFMALMGLGISGKSILCRIRGEEDEVHVRGADMLVGILLPGVILLAAFGLIGILGFYGAEFILIIVLLFLQDKVSNGKVDLRPRRLAVVLVFAAAAIVVMYVLFGLIFHLPVPKGIFQ